ncbi:unnamed protein product [Heligmosomoides polygyrus]|uniref:PKD_channel domain-containing protein n=1 Tax=Heligmosomoides polygyrus TaxID=6339 RepID=A0A183FIF2_HELPZ|nr:unnamed protein product [Heligmosomoides polygyrus]
MVRLRRVQYPIAPHENGSHAFAKVSLTFKIRSGQDVNPMSTTSDYDSWWNWTHDGLLVNLRRTWVCTKPGTYINWVRCTSWHSGFSVTSPNTTGSDMLR